MTDNSLNCKHDRFVLSVSFQNSNWKINWATYSIQNNRFAMSCGNVRVKLSCLHKTFTAKKTEIWFREDYFSALITIPIKSTFKVEVGTPNSIKITGLSIKNTD